MTQPQKIKKADTSAKSSEKKTGKREPKAKVEGEGSYSAARKYQADLKEHIRHNDVEAEAHAAREALEGAEGDELRRAERRGRKPARS